MNEPLMLQTSGRPAKRSAWLAMFCAIAICLPPLLIRVGDRISTHTMENVALVVSQETWLRWTAGQSDAFWVTFNDGLPRVQKPPLATWLNFIAWSDLSPREASPELLTYRARLVSVALGVVLLVSVFWAGCTLGDVRTAVLATLIAGSMWFFQRQARWASYDIHFVAWSTLAVASGLWAILGSRPTQVGDDGQARNPEAAGAGALSRLQPIAGWVLCGVAMGAAVFSKNPLAFAIVAMPLIGAIALHGRSRLVNSLGLTLAIGLALLPALAWYLHVWRSFPDLRITLEHEFQQPRETPQPWYYYVGLLGLIAPWPIWLVCGIVHPLQSHSSSQRARLLVAWIWFVLVLLLFSIPAAKQQRYILPILPSAALLIAQVVRHHQDLAERGQHDKVARLLGDIMAGALVVVSLSYGLLTIGHEWLISTFSQWHLPHQFEPSNTTVAIAATTLLTAIAVAVWKWNAQWRPERAAYGAAVWMILLMALMWCSYIGDLARVAHCKAEAERIADHIGTAPLYSLRATRSEWRSYLLNEEFRIYFGRLIERITPNELARTTERTSPVYVLARPTPEHRGPLEAAGFRPVDQVQTDVNELLDVWVNHADVISTVSGTSP